MGKNLSGNMKNNRLLSRPFAPYITALIGTCAFGSVMALTSTENIRYTNSIFSFIVFGLSAFVLVKIWDEFLLTDKRSLLCSAVFSLLLSIALQFGSRLEKSENVRFDRLSLWIGILALSVFLIPLVCVLWKKAGILCQRMAGLAEHIKADTSRQFNFFQIWGIIFLLWIPTFLALYPGAFVYDAQEEYIEVISRTFTMHHPLLHVLMLGGIVHGAEYLGQTANTGIAVYVILQMVLISFILTYSIKRMEQLGVRKTYLTFMMLFYGLFPLFPLYAVCTAKDGMFTAFLFLMTVELVIYVKQPEDFNPSVFTVASVIMMLLRNNGVYAFTVSMAVILICEFIRTKKDAISVDIPADRKRVTKVLILTLLSLVLFFGLNFVLKTATKATDEEHQEILTVPIQQLTRTYVYSKEVFDEEDIKTLQEIIPEEYLATYRFRVSDIVKSGFDNAAYSKDPGKYRRLWLKIGLKKPLIYINAWLGTSYGYWYPDALNNVYSGNQMYTYQYDESSYFGFETEPPGKRESKFRVLELFYENLSLKLFQQRLPVISMLFSPGFLWWICAFVLFGMICKKGLSSRAVLIILPAVTVYLTVLLGPTTLVRYVLILWFILPIYPVCMSFCDVSEKSV